MVGIRELNTDVLSVRTDNCVAIILRELARRKGVSVSRLLNELIHDAIDKELDLKTDAEILAWTRDLY